MRFALSQEGARECRRAKRGGVEHLLPLFFVSVADKGVTGVKSVSVASKGVAGGQLRLISAKTRSLSASVHSKALVRSRRLPETTNADSSPSRPMTAAQDEPALQDTPSPIAMCIIQEIVDLSIGERAFGKEICGKRGKGMGMGRLACMLVGWNGCFRGKWSACAWVWL